MRQAELDWGASISAVSDTLSDKLFKNIRLTAPSVILYIWLDDKLDTSRPHASRCCYKNKVADLEIVVVQNRGRTVLGRDFIRFLIYDL